MRRSAYVTAFAVLLTGTIGCAAPAVSGTQDGRAAPAPAMPAAADTSPGRADRGYTEADVEFMQGMIAHHAQALVMTALVPDRAESRDVPLLAERIEVSQRDEIARMAKWLSDRGEQVPAVAMDHSRHHMGREPDPAMHEEHHPAGMDHELMPGMLTPEELAALEEADGIVFDRLFLDSMIRHHQGALVMIAGLFASPGAGQEPEIFQFAADAEADQAMEIERMQRMRAIIDQNLQRNRP